MFCITGMNTVKYYSRTFSSIYTTGPTVAEKRRLVTQRDQRNILIPTVADTVINGTAEKSPLLALNGII